MQKALDAVALGYDLNGHTATIQLADGVYSTTTIPVATVAGPLPGQRSRLQLLINGNAANTSNVVLTCSAPSLPTVDVGNGGMASLTNLKLVNTGGGALVRAAHHAHCSINTGVEFGSTSVEQVLALNNSSINIDGSYKISGSAAYHFYVDSCSSIYAMDVSPAITLIGTPAFSGAFAGAKRCSAMKLNGLTFIGSATGARYVGYSGSAIETAGGPSYLPGNSAGSLFTNATYS